MALSTHLKNKWVKNYSKKCQILETSSFPLIYVYYNFLWYEIKKLFCDVKFRLETSWRKHMKLSIAHSTVEGWGMLFSWCLHLSVVFVLLEHVKKFYLIIVFAVNKIQRFYNAIILHVQILSWWLHGCYMYLTLIFKHLFSIRYISTRKSRSSR